MKQLIKLYNLYLYNYKRGGMTIGIKVEIELQIRINCVVGAAAITFILFTFTRNHSTKKICRKIFRNLIYSHRSLFGLSFIFTIKKIKIIFSRKNNFIWFNFLLLLPTRRLINFHFLIFNFIISFFILRFIFRIIIIFDL